MNMIIMEGDTNIAVMSCGCCFNTFRADLSRVTTANKEPICLPCIKAANPKRIKLGMTPIPFVEEAYLGENITNMSLD